MQNPAYGLRRKPLLGTWVSKGKEKGRGCYAPALSFALRDATP
jgi:hypothetical protein